MGMMPLNYILRKCTDGYKLRKSQEKIYHLMYMDDIKLFAKTEKELETLIPTVRIYSQDIGMEFGTILIMERGKRQITEGKELPNQEKKSERSKKRKFTITWKLTPSNKWR